ncbi:MAG TPA: lactonase family protein [Candidatus Acidoferrum sp.]|nr:lactonase family protein [Candidatus Acidoferrum sp.]
MRISKRTLLIISFLAAFLLPSTFGRIEANPPSAKHYLVYVGTYTTKTASKGIYAFRYDANLGKLTPVGVAAETQDPSWVAVHPNGKFLYAVNEAGKNSMVSAFSLDSQSGKLTLLNQLPALGEDPCYLSFDRTGKYLFVANYTSGNVVVFPIEADGKISAATANVRDEGKLGPNKERQEGPHAHWIEASAGNRYAYVSDLGLDKVLIYKFDAASGTLTNPGSNQSEAFSATLPPGAGPRHLAFSRNGNFMYVLGEVQSTVTVFANGAREKYREVQTISALPKGFSGRNDAAEIAIHPSGKFLYSSNRGHESIALFRIDAASGKLTAIGDYSVEGKEPRHFAIDPAGKFLLAEDQLSDRIVTFRIDQKTGVLTATGDSVEVPSPVCLTFLPVD